MDVALNINGRQVSADRATRGGRYLCAYCRVRAVFVPEGKRIAHFKHAPRTPDEVRREKDCPVYHPEVGGGGSLESSTDTPSRPPPPRPRLGFSWLRRGGGEDLRWALLVNVPPVPDDVAFVQVDQNIDGDTFISREQLTTRRPVWVRASGIQYAVRGFDRSRRRVYPTDFGTPTDPLDIRLANVFNAGVSGGLQLEPDDPVQRGRNYFLLARVSAKRVPPPEISRRADGFAACDRHGEWVGHLVYVPVRREPQLDRWIKEACERDIVDPRPRLELVSPPLTRLDPDGTHSVGSGAEIVLGIRGGEWVKPHVEVVDERTGRTEAWVTEIAAGGYLLCRQVPAGEFTVHVHEWEWVSLRLRVAPDPSPFPPQVCLRTRPVAGGLESRAALHTSAAGDRWAALLSGSETWGRAEMSVSVPVTLSWQSASGTDQEAHDLNSPERLAAALADCLMAGPSVARLDAGAFGRVEWTRPVPAASPPLTTVQLSRPLEQRLKWLLLPRPRTRTESGVPLGIRLAPEWKRRVVGPQEHLVSAFVDQSDWSPELVAHARSAARELAGLFWIGQ